MTISSKSFLGDYDRHECGIRVEGAGSVDEGLWTCAMEYYKFGGGKGSSKILKKDTAYALAQDCEVFARSWGPGELGLVIASANCLKELHSCR